MRGAGNSDSIPPLIAWLPLLSAGWGGKERVLMTSGKALKVTIYLSDGAKHKGVPVYTSILDFLFKNGIAGASVFKGVAGFGLHHHMHAAHILDLSDHLPIKIEFIDAKEKVDGLLPQLEERCACGLMEVQEITVIVPKRA